MGAWIEISQQMQLLTLNTVAPLVGAWIEIHILSLCVGIYKSLPLWERGLKSYNFAHILEEEKVAPLVGAWIEMQQD